MSKTNNLSKSNNFSIVFSEVPLLPRLVKSISLPSISSPAGDISNLGQKIKIPSNTLTFENLNISFRLDSDHTIVQQIYSWATSYQINDCIKTNARSTGNEVKADLTIVIKDNNQKDTLKYTFIGCLLDGFSLPDMTNGESIDLVGGISLSYDYFQIVKL